MGRDASNTPAGRNTTDWKPLGSGQVIYQVWPQVTAKVRVSGGSTAIHPPTPKPPSFPAALLPGGPPASAPTALPSLHAPGAGTRALHAPLPGTWAGAPGPSPTMRAGMRRSD